MSFPIISSPAGPYVQGTQFVYDANLVAGTTTGAYRPMFASDLQSTAISDGPNLDAFSRLRTSEGVGLFDSTFQYNLQPLIYHQITGDGGSIAHVPAIVSAGLTVNTVSGAYAILQTKQYHRYIPAKGQLIAMTQIPGAATENVVKRFGYFDNENGIFFEQNGTADVAVVRRTSTSGTPEDNRVVQGLWNMDRMDGTGPSGVRLDLSKSCILIIDLQWLGMGRVRIGFDIDGQIYYVHEFLNANVLAVPYMQTANLPIRWEIRNVGTSAGATFYSTCASVQSEGGAESDRGYYFSAVNPSEVTATTTRTMILAIRPATGFNGQVNRIQIQPSNINILAGANPVMIETFYNPTLAGGAWNSANAYSSVEWGTGQSISDPGVRIASFFVGSSTANRGDSNYNISARRYPLTVDFSGYNPISYMITATATTSTSVCRADIEWAELF